MSNLNAWRKIHRNFLHVAHYLGCTHQDMFIVCSDTRALLSYSNFTHLRKTWCRRVTCLVLEPSMLEWSGQNTRGNYHPNLFWLYVWNIFLYPGKMWGVLSIGTCTGHGLKGRTCDSWKFRLWPIPAYKSAGLDVRPDLRFERLVRSRPDW